MCSVCTDSAPCDICECKLDATTVLDAEHWQAVLIATFSTYSLWEVAIRTLGLLQKVEGFTPTYLLAAGLFIFDGTTHESSCWCGQEYFLSGERTQTSPQKG